MPLLTIPYREPLVSGRLLKRYKRFLADVELADGRVVTAHCVNTGAMEGLTRPGLPVWLSHQPSPKRKLAYTWELTQVDGVLVGTNTGAPNGIVGALLRARVLPGLDWDELRGEFPYGTNSRVDFWLRQGDRQHFVEVKNCHLTYPDGFGYFPDTVSDRAAKHLEELVREIEKGHRATVIFTAQRADTLGLRPSDVHDPVFATTARAAARAGVAFRAVRIEPTPEALVVHEEIPVDVAPYDPAPARTWREANRRID